LLRGRLDRLETRAGMMLGCGTGDEVLYLKRALGSTRMVGLDSAAGFSPLARVECGLVVGDAQSLPFPSTTFDFVASIHSLEHVQDPRLTLAETQRVLRPGGWFYVGVPNKTRLLGYVGSFDATRWEKVKWNFVDYWDRLRGRFENKLGAHAGFKATELTSLLGAYFADVRLITGDYLRFKYGGRLPKLLLDFLLAARFINYSAPSHYAICRRE